MHGRLVSADRRVPLNGARLPNLGFQKLRQLYRLHRGQGRTCLQLVSLHHQQLQRLGGCQRRVRSLSGRLPRSQLRNMRLGVHQPRLRVPSDGSPLHHLGYSQRHLLCVRCWLARRHMRELCGWLHSLRFGVLRKD